MSDQERCRSAIASPHCLSIASFWGPRCEQSAPTPWTFGRRCGNCIAVAERGNHLSYPNAGSIFKNPPGEHAGHLIDQLGLKGYRIGDAQVSLKHANFIVNCGQASVLDVLALIDYVKCQVLRHTGILLEEEVRIVGE